MDFAKLVTEYLNQRTEGDPSFIVSEEALAFVDLMRADDMDRRALRVESATNSDARGEPSSEQVTSEVHSDAVSESNPDSDPVFQDESPEVITTPASPYSDVALGGNQDAGVISDMPESDTASQPSSVFTEDYESPEPSSVFTEINQGSDPSPAITEDYESPEPSSVFAENHDSPNPSAVFTEDHDSPEPASEFSEDSQQSEPSAVFTEDSQQSEPSPQVTENHQPSEPASIFTETGDSVAPNSALQEEGVIVSEQGGLRNETTILAPQSMPDFEALLQSFDRDYYPPDPPAGDLDLVPQMEDEEPSEPLQNTTEFCEGMMSGILNSYLATDRRGA